MKKINFEPIGKAMQAFDTDLMDIYRRIEITNPDGTTGESSMEEPLYKGIPCHIAFINADNPNPETIDTKPIIVGIQINCALDVDLQNNDYIKAYKLSDSGETLETYQGVIGFPTTSQSRKSAQMQMRTDV